MANSPCGVTLNTVIVPGPVAPPAFILSENNRRIWLSVTLSTFGGANVYFGRFDATVAPPGVSDVSHFLFWTGTDQTNNPILFKDWGLVLQSEVWANVGPGTTLIVTEGVALVPPPFGNGDSCDYSYYSSRFKRSNFLGTLDLIPLFPSNSNRVGIGVTGVGGVTGGIYSNGQEFIQSVSFRAQRICTYRNYGPIITGEIAVKDALGGSGFFELVGIP
jgi:hypothetical protein